MPRTPTQGVAFLLGFVIALWLSPFLIGVAHGDAAESRWGDAEASLLEAVNAERERMHLIPLLRNRDLDAVARAHSADMARRNYLSHVNPEGLNPLERVQEAGIGGLTLVAENAGLTDRNDPTLEILQSWLTSPEHRRNLHAPPFNRTGLGIVRAGNGTWYVTQLYATVPR
ncbi:MAG: CAP domain-containing protein [Myxococcota bacterium]|nr:CAP domain-containing protein [bacterium]MDP6074892.1 CAP domain-containing protein [Myxococcota bacterium]MDP6244569.1 CAP domain-containing protein [Myxococcota bacterium]MDP7075199.1 CAP domain-containing protein [Myxococcota bacterium]MDP7300881.1 CAP domain-containing protein [Myxococcota bacterium]